MSEMFSIANVLNINTRSSTLRLVQPKRKTNAGLNSLSYVGPSYWNKLSGFLKQSDNLNTFKHNLKKNFLQG